MFDRITLTGNQEIDTPVLLTAMRSCECSRIAEEKAAREERDMLSKRLSALEITVAVLGTRIAVYSMLGACIGGAAISLISRLLVP